MSVGEPTSHSVPEPAQKHAAGRTRSANMARTTSAAPPRGVRVLVPSALFSYTGGAREVDIDVAAHADPPIMLADVVAAFDARFPGVRFRIIDEQGCIRQHIKIFVSGDLARDLATPVSASAEVMIVGALSGG